MKLSVVGSFLIILLVFTGSIGFANNCPSAYPTLKFEEMYAGIAWLHEAPCSDAVSLASRQFQVALDSYYPDHLGACKLLNGVYVPRPIKYVPDYSTCAYYPTFHGSFTYYRIQQQYLCCGYK